MALLVRQRRHQQPLTLPLPLPLEISSSDTQIPWHNIYPLPMLSNGPDSPIIETLSDLEKLEVLGRGNGGTVYKVQHRRNSCVYALKVIRFEYDSAPIRHKAVREAEILKQLDSEYLIRCFGVFESDGYSDNGTLCFLLEYMERGSLKDVMELHGRLPENLISCVAKRVLEGLNYLHGLHIVHRDIKPSNLLMNSQGEVKIADFGVSRVVQGTLDTNDSCEGTCAYMSPERFDCDRSQCDDFAGDVWALGLALLECYLGHFPLVAPGEKPDWATLVCAICSAEPPDIPKTASSHFKSFIYRCLEKDWRRRGTVSELLCHPFVVKCISSNQKLVGSF